MIVLTVGELSLGTICFTRDSKTECLFGLQRFFEDSSLMDEVELELEIGYKETRTIRLTQNEWTVNINENGVGEVREFESRREAIQFFIGCASENGEHWDVS